MKVFRVTNISKTISLLKENGYWIYATAVDKGKDVSLLGETKYFFPAAVVLGSEDKGDKKAYERHCRLSYNNRYQRRYRLIERIRSFRDHFSSHKEYKKVKSLIVLDAYNYIFYHHEYKSMENEYLCALRDTLISDMDEYGKVYRYRYHHSL
jgi:hypothetical protein